MRDLSRLLSSPRARGLALAGWTCGAISAGYYLRLSDEQRAQRQLPAGYRACCDGRELSGQQRALPGRLSAIVGASHVKCGVEQKGSRIGSGAAFAVVQPGSLQQCLECLEACVAADAAVIPQGANTGLTGGSVPRGAEQGLDRPTVVINLTRLNTISPIDDGKRLVCLAGAGIHSALKTAAELGRESHCVLGSIFLNPTTAAGVAFGSGGTQLRKGPVYTERLLYARVNEQGKVELVNTLGLKGEQTELFAKLESGGISQEDVDPQCKWSSSQTSYGDCVCQIEGQAGRAVSRFNASTAGPDPNRSEGKVLILASVHDTFEKPKSSRLLWISVPDLATAHKLKREVCLSGGARGLPNSCEYMDKDSIRAVDEGGRILCWLISVIGIGENLKSLWDAKLSFESLPIPFATTFLDSTIFLFNRFCPRALPEAVHKLTTNYGHHLLVDVGEFGAGESDHFMSLLKEYQSKHCIAVHECSEAERPWVSYFRFAAAPAFRTWCVGNGLEGISVDYALPKAECDAPALPDDIVALRMRYSHFGCNVVHEDIAFKPGVDVHEVKMKFKHRVEDMGGKLPAEHGHGIEYHAPEETLQRWRAMDPLNIFNPGVGGLSIERKYGTDK